MKILVTGSRHWTDSDRVLDTLAEFVSPAETINLAHGNARGADRMAGAAAVVLGYDTVRAYPVDPELDGPWPAAGHRRNERMLDDFKPDLVIAFRAAGKSNGTDGCIKAAMRRGIPVRVEAA